MSDLLEIRALADRYASAVDDGDLERMASLFAPGGSLRVFAPGGAEPLKELPVPDGVAVLLRSLAECYVRWVHIVPNHWAQLDAGGTTGSGETYTMAFHLLERDGALIEEMQFVRYRDAFIRLDDGWRFARRDAFRQWTNIRPVDPGRFALDAVMARALAGG